MREAARTTYLGATGQIIYIAGAPRAGKSYSSLRRVEIGRPASIVYAFGFIVYALKPTTTKHHRDGLLRKTLCCRHIRTKKRFSPLQGDDDVAIAVAVYLSTAVGRPGETQTNLNFQMFDAPLMREAARTTYLGATGQITYIAGAPRAGKGFSH